jgi:N-methylhydantoinase A/oxoprolinase/acetone carboxylase beta subunit
VTSLMGALVGEGGPSPFGKDLRIGIDVGGTNTDAVVMQQDRVLREVKATTSVDVTEGIVNALVGLGLDDSLRARVGAVMIGTTHFTNAFVEAKDLAPCGVIRLCLPATAAVPPFSDWPTALLDAVGGHFAMCHGGHEFDGRRISAVDREEIRRVAEAMGERGVRSVAITSVFSPLTADAELEAADVVREILPDVHLSLSHNIGRIGLIERENATIINASLRQLAETTMAAFGDSLSRAGIAAPLFISQNDGTLMGLNQARQYPVLTFASGPTNSMRGAAFLSGFENCIVVDVGGTTTDVGVVAGGFPRPAGGFVELAGVRTNFRMPDVLSIGIGGGSHVFQDRHGLHVGPTSVGRRLEERALVFGGDVLTATDVAVAAGQIAIGDPSLVRHLPPTMVGAGLRAIRHAVEVAVERMRSSAQPIPWVLVGGGSTLVPSDVACLDPLMRPDHFAVANAVGAAIAQVSGEVDQVLSVPRALRDTVLDKLKTEAVERAVSAGALKSSVDIVEVDEVPITYLPDDLVRVRVKAVGDLDLSSQKPRESLNA